MRPLGQRLVDWATSQLGVAEDPPLSNAGPPMERYALPGEDPLPWCGRFVRAAFTACDAPLPGNPYELAAVAHIHHVFEEQGWLLATSSAPQPGDLVLMKRRDPRNRRGMHCCFVEAAAGTKLWTIGGNEGDAVRRVLRHLFDTDIVAFGRRPDPQP